ncbi:Uncharacterised protein [Mycobacteroides abscessus]|nr:Uncharacterised protein [Mycobacteroides abscessus]
MPPYASSGTITWSPGRTTARSSVSSAARPDAKANPRAAGDPSAVGRRPPDSAAASASSRAVRVGFAEREYS